ncbi:MAG: hypothetical protein GW815_03385 [Candidatus Moranbacteria bacterium]|nr:hypothetical protein [Candidatus Moranbacteria bacterium]OIQ02435.1 MAG: hypothetical protein AUK58_03155 [Candidatus Moranbacteria bacterium CG2_30_41_165]PIP25451.1 MAG: hypothetical protein COX32_03390 [Candidatus Moranbacteria bacterium CG23_combo_of_CG06-09_8_20_14_all_41_28]PIV86175.1 MAG: hypothetical protein COW50_02935 [Candidatus Moranbacteria bacterium CG17_big_fil_post_rev_8_21_14_2_50_41_107]PIW94623.1 MAG: hypothetical protein COZ86_00045 [Candidatus Moranbacteria bacterium CG_
MFENLNTPAFTPDEEQVNILKKVEEYFLALSRDYEDNRVQGPEEAEKVAKVLEAIQSGDYAPASEYLSAVIANIEQEQIPRFAQSKIGEEITVPALKQEAEDLQKLLDSLSLGEK